MKLFDKAVVWLWGPLLTVVFTLTYGFLIPYLNIAPTSAMVFIFVVLGAFVGGWPAGVLSAVWGIVYSYWLLGDIGRVAQIGIALLVTVAAVSWQSDQIRKQAELARANQAKADLVDSANGNINRLRTVLKIIDDLLAGWGVLSDPAKQGVIQDIRNQLATLTLLVVGWRVLAREKKLVIKEEEMT